jgi:phosphate starvation-inducible PhoH-like protein
MPLPKESELFYGLKLTDEQREYVDSIFDNQLTIVNAKAGTGKTTLAVGAAKIIAKPLYYIFAPVEEDALGYTPGDVEEKEAKYIQPLLDALKEIKEDHRFALHREEHPDHIKKMAWVYAKSHVFARGTNIKNATVIIDEAQNFTRGDLKKILTRIHDTCKVIVIGHDGQCDLDDRSKSGFMPYIEHFRVKDYCKVVCLTKNFRGRLAKHADELHW